MNSESKLDTTKALISSSHPQSINAKRENRTLEAIASLGNGLKVLDIGCQGGGFCAQLLGLGHEPHGIEIALEEVESARRSHPTIHFTAGNCEKEIPFPAGFFDVVWAGEVIEHIGHTDIFVNEINRVLKVGGHFILSTPMHNRLKNLGVVLFKFERHFNPEFPHYRFYSKRSLSLVLGRRGFRIIEVDYIGRIPPVANVIFVVAEKVATKSVISEFREFADNRDAT